MVKFGCVPPLVKILTKQSSTPAEIIEALETIDLILGTGEDMHFLISAMEKDGSMDAIVKLQVLCSFDDSSCFAIQNVTLFAGRSLRDSRMGATHIEVIFPIRNRRDLGRTISRRWRHILD
jgi:hypothetical protein